MTGSGPPGGAGDGDKTLNVAVDEAAGTEIGWGRAIVSGIVILAVGFAAAVIGANRILTKALGLRRAPREWLATALFFFVIVVLAWALRRLQARKVI